MLKHAACSLKYALIFTETTQRVDTPTEYDGTNETPKFNAMPSPALGGMGSSFSQLRAMSTTFGDLDEAPANGPQMQGVDSMESVSRFQGRTQTQVSDSISRAPGRFHEQ